VLDAQTLARLDELFPGPGGPRPLHLVTNGDRDPYEDDQVEIQFIR
jgi:hypothetical protein